MPFSWQPVFHDFQEGKFKPGKSLHKQVQGEIQRVKVSKLILHFKNTFGWYIMHENSSTDNLLQLFWCCYIDMIQLV